jgi:8-oxo-dGTP pyrophosphatase MutT (NUDIX family)
MTVDIEKLYGSPHKITLSLPSVLFPPVSRRRHGEVCMAIRRPNGRFLLHTKSSYPGAVMRLPSGGIKRGEDIEHALLREIWEETNLSVEVERYLAAINYADAYRRSPFLTHLFVVRETDGELRNNDPKEDITQWREAGVEELAGYADALRRVGEGWHNWGLFRAAALDILADHCGTGGD